MRASKWWIKISIPPSAFLQLWALTTSRALKTQPNSYHCSLLGNNRQTHGSEDFGESSEDEVFPYRFELGTKSSAEPGISTGTIAPPEPAVRLQGRLGTGRPGKTDHRQMQCCTESEQIHREGCKASDEAEGQQAGHNTDTKEPKKWHWSEEFLLKAKFKEN